MYNIINATPADGAKLTEFWNYATKADGFFKPIADYKAYLENIPHFDWDGVKLCYDGNKLVGVGVAIKEGDLTKNPEAMAQINMILVDPAYRKHGIANQILVALEEWLKNAGYKKVRVLGHLPSCYPWYIPETDHHDHPCAPGVAVNSDIYLFLIHHRYEAIGFQDAFHLPLAEYEISPKIQTILDENAKDGITIDFFDPAKHEGVDEFCEKLGLGDFTSVIKGNLALEKPLPFLVVLQGNKVVGWTGALWNEESGRGHFDGIAILDTVRGRGLGKALFSLLAYHSKQNGAKFMTFYTNLNNHARYVYMGAGFKICQTFAYMTKVLK